jgi:hypothetical protein
MSSGAGVMTPRNKVLVFTNERMAAVLKLSSGSNIRATSLVQPTTKGGRINGVVMGLGSNKSG